MCEKKNISIVNMGGNPLPIYVLLKYFSEPITKKENQTNVGNEKVLNKLYHPHKIIIIYSNKTNYYFDRLVKILRRDKKADITKSKIIGINLKNAQRDFLKITKILTKNYEIGKILDNTENFHFHYNITGGTKPMVIEIYNFLKSKITSPSKLILSDISPDNFKIQIMNQNGSGVNSPLRKFFPKEGNLRDKIKLTPKILFNLHDIEYSRGEDTESPYYERKLINLLMKMNLNRDNSKNRKLFQKWHYLLGKDLYYNQEKNEFSWKKQKYQKNRKKEAKKLLGKSSPFHDLSNCLRSHADQWGKIGKFITGGWFEEFTFHCLKQLGVFDELRLNVFGKFRDRPFEIDILGIKGYQPFLFTITTSLKISRVKKKGFEGLYRAREFGGSHSKVFLISLLPTHKLEKLEDDFIEFRADRDLLIFGAQDVLNEHKNIDRDKFKKTLKININEN